MFFFSFVACYEDRLKRQNLSKEEFVIEEKKFTKKLYRKNNGCQQGTITPIRTEWDILEYLGMGEMDVLCSFEMFHLATMVCFYLNYIHICFWDQNVFLNILYKTVIFHSYF